jgi:hypothetical protein
VVDTVLLEQGYPKSELFHRRATGARGMGAASLRGLLRARQGPETYDFPVLVRFEHRVSCQEYIDDGMIVVRLPIGANAMPIDGTGESKELPGGFMYRDLALQCCCVHFFLMPGPEGC